MSKTFAFGLDSAPWLIRQHIQGKSFSCPRCIAHSKSGSDAPPLALNCLVAVLEGRPRTRSRNDRKLSTYSSKTDSGSATTRTEVILSPRRLAENENVIYGGGADEDSDCLFLRTPLELNTLLRPSSPSFR